MLCDHRIYKTIKRIYMKTFIMTLLLTTQLIFTSNNKNITHSKTKNARNYFISQMDNLNCGKIWQPCTRHEYINRAGAITPEPQSIHILPSAKTIQNKNRKS